MADWLFTIDDIRCNTEGESYPRGEEYAEHGAVLSITRRGNRLIAEVEGSDVEPYLVSILLSDKGIVAAECTCPYDWGGWCKHIVAALLTCLQAPGAAEERSSLETMLAALDRNQLAELLTRLAEADPRLIDAIDGHLGRIAAPSASAGAVTSHGTTAPLNAADPPVTAPPNVPNAKAIQKDIRAAARDISRGGYDEYDDEGLEALDEMDEATRPYLDIAQAFLDAGMGLQAMEVLVPLTEALIDQWDIIGDRVGSLDTMFREIGGKMAEALLSSDMPASERLAWVTRLRALSKAGNYMGADEGLAAAEQAALTGWDYPPLLRVLHGEVDERGAWDGEPPDGSDELAIARLNVLERQGRIQEAIYFAEAEGQTLRYLILLIRAGKAPRAFDEGREQLTDRADILKVAQAMAEHSERDLALKLAEHGLTVVPTVGSINTPVKPLADWLRDKALETGDIDLSIKAAVLGLEESPSLSDYQRLEQIAGSRMEAIRGKLLESLSDYKGYSVAGAVDILLHEGRNAEALRSVKDIWDYNLTARVIDSVMAQLPEETIPISQKEANRIMDPGRAAHYDAAARWVQRVRDAYRVLHQETEWQAYKASLLEKHGRKYKLVPMLKAL